MKFFFPALLFLFFINIASSQSTALKYAETITGEGLKTQLSVIASAEMEGRETATEGQRKAAAYIESQFKEIGLGTPPSLNNYQQYYPLNKDTLIPKTLKIGKEKYDFGKDYIVTPGSSDENEFKSKNIIFAGYGIADENYDDYAGKNVKDKVVIVFMGEPKVNDKYLVSDTATPSTWGFNTQKKAILAKQKGAVALIVVNPSADSISDALTQQSKKSNLYFSRETDSAHEKVPVITITPDVLKNIIGGQQASEIIAAAKAKQSLNEFAAEKNIKSKLAYRKIKIPAQASNVIGFIEGTDKKDEYVFLTAHYDHLGKKGTAIYYGADDDGSGTATIIEMARAFTKAKADGFGPRRTVVFMTVSGEEEGLLGSEYYSDHPIFPLDKTTVNLNTDMIGRIDTERKSGDSLNYIYVIGHDKLSTDLAVINEGVNNKCTHLTLDYKFDDPLDKERIYFRSDHYNFARKGVPVLFFYDGMLLGDYHKPTDTIDKINWELYEKRACFIFLNAWEIANRDNMLKRDLPLPPKQD